MKYSPHEYQRFAAEYIKNHPVAAVLLDMGLGKTSITLTALNDLLFDSFDIHRVLVIAPLRVARNTWSAEIDKWDHLRMLQYSIAVGTEAERLAALIGRSGFTVANMRCRASSTAPSAGIFTAVSHGTTGASTPQCGAAAPE